MTDQLVALPEKNQHQPEPSGLQGEGFSAVKHYRLPRRLVRREQYVLEQCTGKRVLHLGFADFSTTGDIHGAVTSTRWLHRKIEQVAAEVVGVDNAADAVHALSHDYGMPNLHVADAERLDDLMLEPFDVVLAGEIIEHLPNPGAFLKSARTVLKTDGTVVITTVNAFCLRKLLQVARGQESVHEDHVAYYSHRTLQRLAEMHGYQVVEQCSYKIPQRKPWLPYIVEALASRISPNLCEGVIVKLRKSPG